MCIRDRYRSYGVATTFIRNSTVIKNMKSKFSIDFGTAQLLQLFLIYIKLFLISMCALCSDLSNSKHGREHENGIKTGDQSVSINNRNN